MWFLGKSEPKFAYFPVKRHGHEPAKEVDLRTLKVPSTLWCDVPYLPSLAVGVAELILTRVLSFHPQVYPNSWDSQHSEQDFPHRGFWMYVYKQNLHSGKGPNR